jgi:hypothetical protein
VDRATQFERIEQRWRQPANDTFAMTASSVDRSRTQFEVPDPEELSRHDPFTPPALWTNCGNWAEHRPPSLSTS